MSITLILGVDSALTVERAGVTTNNTEFCIGERLTFRCPLREGSYEWIFTDFLNGTVGYGRVTNGNSMAVGEFMVAASGAETMDADTRMSTLQVTVFEGLVGERTVTCGESASISNTQSATITVLGESD